MAIGPPLKYIYIFSWTYGHVYERGYRLNLWPHLLNVAIGPPLKYIYIYIYIYLAGPIATFMNVAIDLTYGCIF